MEKKKIKNYILLTLMTIFVVNTNKAEQTIRYYKEVKVRFSKMFYKEHIRIMEKMMHTMLKRLEPLEKEIKNYKKDSKEHKVLRTQIKEQKEEILNMQKTLEHYKKKVESSEEFNGYIQTEEVRGKIPKSIKEETIKKYKEIIRLEEIYIKKVNEERKVHKEYSAEYKILEKEEIESKRTIEKLKKRIERIEKEIKKYN